MTFQRRLGIAFALMAIPLLMVAALAYRSNRLEREALESLGRGLGRSRTYAEVESALQAQGEIVWRALSGFEADPSRELETNRQVVTYWLDRWEAGLLPDEAHYAAQVRRLRAQIDTVTDSIMVLAARGRRDEGYGLARRELQVRLFPALTTLNHEIYRQTRTASVQRAFLRVEQIVDRERKLLFVIMAAAIATGLLLAAAFARSLVRPITDLRAAMAVVGAGNLEHPISTAAPDEIGDLARSFGEMTDRLRESSAAREALNAELAAKIAQLERTQAQLVESEKLASVGQMAAAVAHGLRNPLASLRASAQLAMRHPDTPAARASLAAIVEEVDRLDKRVAHLLTFSRPAPTHQMRERLGVLVDGAIAPLRTLLADRRVALEVTIPETLPEVQVDPMKVETAILEIVSNALDAMPNGGELRLDGGLDDGRVVLAIRDTGRGIPAEALPNVCEPFFTTRAEGTGLGLAIARRFVEQNGGRLEIASTPGEGTTVRLAFPALPAREPAEVA
jgi:signal transduction histidine kinase